MLAEESLRDEMAGSTAIVVLIKDEVLYCVRFLVYQYANLKKNFIRQANVGDSRAIACIAGKEESLSSDHKPSYPTEKRRIRAAGGWVEANRVNGNLALSRALGDFVFKRNESKSAEEQVVTGKIIFITIMKIFDDEKMYLAALPDIEVRNITPEWEFVLLACDGIWDVMGRSVGCRISALFKIAADLLICAIY